VSSVDPKAFNDLALSQVRVNNLIDIVLIDKGVPNRFRVNHTDRAGVTSIEASGLINPYLAGARETECLNPGFGVLPHGLAAAIGTARATIVALIEAKKHVALKMAHWPLARRQLGPGIINACVGPRPGPARARGWRSRVEIPRHFAMTPSTTPSLQNFERPIRV
jgi:hypothetical protein